MRKLIILLSVLLINVSVALAVPSLATTTFSVANSNVPAVGSSFNVPVNIAGFPATVRYIEVVLDYSSSILSYVSVTNVQGGNVATITPGSGKITVNINNGLSAFPVSDGKLFDLVFTYLGGDSPLTFDAACKYRPASGSAIAITSFTNGSITGGLTSSSISSGPWETAGGWSQGVVPNSFHNVTVASGTEVTISSAAVCNNLTIADGGKLTLTSGNTLTVGGNFEIASGGSFIQNGTLAVTGTTTAKRYISAANWTNQFDGWHLLSSPVASQAISGSFTPTGTNNDYDMYVWNEPTQFWDNQKLGGMSTFNVGKGYLVAYQQAGTKEFVGTLNNTDKSVTLTKSGSGPLTSYGYNLLGNPFSSALTWGTGWTLDNIGPNGTYVWSDSQKDYHLLSVGDPIPAMNGFFVFTSAASQSLTIPAAARTHSATSWYKSADQQIKLIAHDPDGQSYKESMIRFNPDATSGFDLAYDAYLLSGFAPKLYSVADGSAFTLNTLPAVTDGMVIPFGFIKNSSTNFSIELAEKLDGIYLSLRDKKTNTVVDLNQNPVYSFTSVDGDDPNRFELMFGLHVNVTDYKALASATAYSTDNKIIVSNVSGITTMDIINVQGQVLNNYKFNSTGNHEISVNLPTGIYMVRLSNSGEIKTMKVFVK